MTSIHAQDFKDEFGDRMVGRRTIPIIFPPSIARLTVIAPLVTWSISLAFIWRLDMLTSVAYLLLALFVGTRYILYRTVADDQVSFYWYNASTSLRS